MVIYNDSSLNHIIVTLFSLVTSSNILSLRHKIMAFHTLSTSMIFTTCVRLKDINASPFDAYTQLFLVKILCIFTFHNIKSLSSKKFLMSHFELMVLTCKINPFVSWWAPLIVDLNSCTMQEL